MPRNSDKQRNQQFDVVVVGAGLVGAASACLFAQQGLTVALLESQSLSPTSLKHESGETGRVSAINLAARNLFQNLDIWQRLTPDMVSSYCAMKVWDYHSPAKISFLATEIGEPSLGYIIHNRDLLVAMLEKLCQNYHVTIMDNVEITKLQRNASQMEITLATGTLTTSLLVGADGSRSRVRELCAIPSRFSDFAQDAITTTLSTSHAHRATAWQCFLGTGPVAMLPLADGRCSLVWSCDRDKADELMRLNETEFCAQLQPFFLHELGNISACQPRQRFPLAQQHANRYITDSVALLGDAAHSIHPLAGLGANIGFVDAAALAEVVAYARARGKNIGQYSVLRRYERWRKGDNALVLSTMASFKEIFGSSRTTAKAVRSLGMNWVDSITPLKNTLAKFACGLSGDVPAMCRNV